MNTFMKQAWMSWQETRRETLIFIKSLTKEELIRKMPRPWLDTFGVHFQELGVVQGAYAHALRTSKMDFSLMAFEPDIELYSDADKLIEFLNDKDALFREAVESINDPNQIIDWQLPRNPTALEHIYWLMQHETLHHGQFLAFCYVMNINIPEILVQHWNMPPLAPQIVAHWFKEQDWSKWR
jgi:hypothetical protein